MGKRDYSVGLLRRLMANYDLLEEGKNPMGGDGDAGSQGKKGRGTAKAPFEYPLQLKADIDRAIQQLKPREKVIVISVDIDCRRLQECAFWLGASISDVMEWEESAVKSMAYHLNSGNNQRRQYGKGRQNQG